MSEEENKKGKKESSKTHESKETNQEKNSDRGVIPDELLESIPEEERGKVASVIKQTMISGVMRRNNPIAEKITSDT